MCIHRADSLCYTAATNNNVRQLYLNKDVKKKESICLIISDSITLSKLT